MATYSTSLKLTLLDNGEGDGTWGETTNDNLGTLLEQAITGVENITMASADKTLTNYDGVSNEARNAVLVVGGTLGDSTKSIITPAANKLYIVKNNTSGGYSFEIRPTGTTFGTGDGVTVPNGSTLLVYVTPTAAYSGININNITGNLTLTGDLTAVNETLSGTLSVTGLTTVRNIVNAQTVSMTIASPAVVTLGTALPANTPIIFSTTGALPTGVTAGTTYYVYNPVGSTCNLVSTLGGTSAITTSGSQSGTHTAVTGVITAVNSTYAYKATSADTATTAGSVTTTTSNGYGSKAVVPSPLTSAAFTASIATNQLTVSTVSSGTLYIGEVISGTGLPSGTTITAFGVGTTGLTGTYTLSSTCAAGTVDTTADSSTVTLTVTSGTVALGQTITATNIPANTVIVSFGTGTGSSGTYYISTQATATATGTPFANTVTSTSFTGNTSGTASFTGSASSGTTTLTAASVTGGIIVGAYLTGTGIDLGTYVTAYGASTYGGSGTYTISKATTGTVSGAVTASATPTGGSSGDIVYGY